MITTKDIQEANEIERGRFIPKEQLKWMKL